MDILNWIFASWEHFFGTWLLVGTIASFRLVSVKVKHTKEDEDNG
jgi:hypothetical protein